MAEKCLQENPLPDVTQEEQGTPSMSTKMDKPADKPADKPEATPIPPSAPTPVTPHSVQSFTKSPPNDLYRRLLPAVLFLLTFVTVMTMLLIYMDTVALGAQQFRLNMSRDYELAKIGQESPPLVLYVRQLHLAPRAPLRLPPVPEPSPRVHLIHKLLPDTTNGTFIEFVPRGPRLPTTVYLERVEGWSGVAVRAGARDYLSLRGAARALHACLSPTPHPREVTYHEAESQEAAFSSRVLCLPLYTVLLAAEATAAEYVILGGDNVVPAISYLPFKETRLKILDVRSTDMAVRNKTTAFLESKNYTVAATFDDGIMYSLNQS